MRKNQEYIKNLDSAKKKEFEELLKKEGSKSKFRTKIQMTFVYIIASVCIFISLIVTDELVSKQNHLSFLPFVILTIIGLLLYIFYFWRWIKDYIKVRDYVQTYWFKIYYWVIVLTVINFIICFICTIITLTNSNHGFISLSDSSLITNQFNLYYAIIVAIVIEIVFSLIAVGLDTYVIYHLEVDIQKLIKEYDEDQIDYLKDKIKQEVNKIKNDSSKDDILDSNKDFVDSDINLKNEIDDTQKALSQEEIDQLLKQNSLFNNDDKDITSKESHESNGKNK